LFSAPPLFNARSGVRREFGPTRWPVVVFYDAPQVFEKAGQGSGMTCKVTQPITAAVVPPTASSAAGQGIPAINATAKASDGANGDDAVASSASVSTAPLIVLRGNCGGTKVKVLLDSGAERSFASTSFVQSLGMVTYPSAVVHSVRMADGRINPVCRMIPNVKLRMGDWRCKIDLLVTDVDGYDIILGKDWLSAHNPLVDCGSNIVKVRAVDGTVVILPLAASASSTPRVM
jgi:Retroviral aspartyl protease